MAVLSAFTITMNRVLAIPELLDMVFRFLDEESNVSNALVCKQWSEIALDALWRDVYDLRRLFGLLGSLEKVETDDYAFVKLPDSESWKSFERYSRRVRRLSYHVTETTSTLSQSVFNDIGRTRTSLNILPSMHTLEWNAPLPLCVMFMHPNVKSFVIYLPRIFETISPSSFFSDIVARMPNIKRLNLRTNIPMHCIESEAVELFRGLKKLQAVTLPRYNFTTKIAESLSRLDNLGTIEFQYIEEQGCGDPADALTFKPSLEGGAFASLWDLSITISFDDAANFIDMSFAPTNLTTLFIDSQAFETPADVHRLLSVLAENCQLLTSLALLSFVDSNSVSTDQPTKDNCIDIDTLKPLFKCPNLISFELTHQYPLDLQQRDIEEMAIKWPSVETLVLNSEPAYLDKSDLTLNALLPLSRHCPKLRHLGLFIHASNADLPPSPYEYTPFKSLRHLSMGVSLISEEGAVALFLSQLCPLDCNLNSGVTWNVAVTREVARTIEVRCDKWAKVLELLPLLTKLRMEERERARGLQSEVEDLRMRTGVLMDNAVIVGRNDRCVVI